jgi:1-acyl-sn-glycerol-3-phosphate acyltransferase
MKGCRKILRKSLRWIGKAMRFCCGFHRIKINGKRASKSEATIFAAAPHTSFFDMFLFFEIGLPCGVSRAENAKIPVFGFLVRAMQPILVSRLENLKVHYMSKRIINTF